ncbi:MAG: pyrroloquinoline quinone biosynthesis peptide chaperone PqqD [Pseudomonadota bacterium]
MIGLDAVPFLPRGVRLKYDTVRRIDVLLGPERVVTLDGIGKSILDQMDGTSDVAGVAEALSVKYEAPRDVIEPDVQAFLQDLIEKGFVHVAP